MGKELHNGKVTTFVMDHETYFACILLIISLSFRNSSIRSLKEER